MVEIKTETTPPRALSTHHRVEVDGYVVTWIDGMALCCFWPAWLDKPINAADIRKLGVILSEIADTIDAQTPQDFKQEAQSNG